MAEESGYDGSWHQPDGAERANPVGEIVGQLMRLTAPEDTLPVYNVHSARHGFEKLSSNTIVGRESSYVIDSIADGDTDLLNRNIIVSLFDKEAGGSPAENVGTVMLKLSDTREENSHEWHDPSKVFIEFTVRPDKTISYFIFDPQRGSDPERNIAATEEFERWGVQFELNEYVETSDLDKNRELMQKHGVTRWIDLPLDVQYEHFREKGVYGDMDEAQQYKLLAALQGLRTEQRVQTE